MNTVIWISLATLTVALQVQGHGYLWEPTNRGSIWKVHPGAPINYDDMGVFCGGAAVQWQENDGLCGPCGDNYADSAPRNNENGGTYGQGIIARTYYQDTNIQIFVNVTASHGGHFEFHICDLADSNPETEECFNKHPVFLLDGALEYNITKEIDHTMGHIIYVKLPENLTCERCSFRWHWRTGNSYGICDNGEMEMGCGAQETFRNCADISIIPKP